MRGVPASQGGTNAFLGGNFKRKLDPVTVALFASTYPTVPGAQTISLYLKNLCGQLFCHIGAGFSLAPGVNGNNGNNPLLPGDWGGGVLPGLATMQLTPIMDSGAAPKLALRRVFQDPTALQNQDHPLPQDLPFGWEFTTEADQVLIQIALNTVALANVTFNGIAISVQATVEFIGQQGADWDEQSIRRALGQVILTRAGDSMLVQSAL